MFSLAVSNGMKTKQQKINALKELEQDLKTAKMTVFTSYAKAGEKGLNVAKMRDLKKNLGTVNGRYSVVKKTLLDRALKSRKIATVEALNLQDSLGLALVGGDEALTAKTIYGFSRANPALKLFGALIGSEFIDSTRFIELAKLPAREVMIGRAVSMIKYPLSGLMNVLQANTRKLVMVLSAIQIKQ